MFPDDLLSGNRIRLASGASSKKRVLEEVAELFATSVPELTPEKAREKVFNKLLERERLGSTGLGQGIALPHARMKGISEARGALLRLKSGIDFDAIDGQPVDLVFALLVPEQATDQHLQLLAMLAARFSDPEPCRHIRDATDPDAMIRAFQQQNGNLAASA